MRLDGAQSLHVDPAPVLAHPLRMMNPDPKTPAATDPSASVDETLRALADPARRTILKLIRHVERSPTQLASHLSVTPGAITPHMKVLREAGLIIERQEGRRHFFKARPEGLASLHDFIASFGRSATARDGQSYTKDGQIARP